MKKIGFIGAGNMGLPLLMGATKLLGADRLTFFCADEFSNKRAHETTGVEQAESLEKLVQTSECVLLAVKPQSFGEVLPVIKANTYDGQVIISLAPGVTVDYLSAETGGKTTAAKNRQAGRICLLAGCYRHYCRCGYSAALIYKKLNRLPS